MVEEAYVSFETAKLLKEKGFDEECFRFYMPTGNGRWKYEHYHDFDISDRIECPTQQMAMRWLREKYNIIISIAPQRDKYCFTPWQLWDSEWVHTKAMLPLYNSYEEVTEAALKYCLENLI